MAKQCETHERAASPHVNDGHSCDHHGLRASIVGESSQRLKVLIGVLVLTLSYVAVEVIGAFVSGSLALLADAGHMMADVAAIALALVAVWFARRPPTPRRTYGYHRLEILIAFFNGLLLLFMAAAVMWEALQRWQHPHPIASGVMAWVAAGGLLVNVIAIFLLHRFGGAHLTTRSAMLHVIGDTAGSVSALGGALLMASTGWLWIDALVSGVIAVLVAFSAFRLVNEAASVLLENTPAHIDVDAVEREMLALDGVISVHHLHVWTITSGKDVLAAHVVLDETAIDACKGEFAATLSRLQSHLKQRFGFAHLTLQLEPPGFTEEAPQF